jgi:chaperonin cofactor prefoldin
MPRSLSFAILLIFFSAFSAAAQSADTSSQQPPSPTPQQPADTQKPKKVWTNENLSGAHGAVSVVGDPKSQPKPATSKPANTQYAASARKQLEKLQQQVDDVEKQLVDLKNFSEGEPSTSASGIKLNHSYNREPIEVQIRALQEKKKDLQSKMDALLDEARKKGVEPGQLR